MPRMQVYLPEDLYTEVKARGLPASELLRKAVIAELRRLELVEEGDGCLAELIAEVGEPSPAERARAEEILARMTAPRSKRAG